MKTRIFLDITAGSQVKVNRRFGGTCGLHLQDGILSQARNHLEASSKQSTTEVVHPYDKSAFTGLHGVLFRRTELITTVVKTLDPTYLVCLQNSPFKAIV
jgi:hypothetical protein